MNSDQIQADLLSGQLQDIFKRVPHGGVAAGVYAHGVQRPAFGGQVSADRPVPPDERTLFEIGSITKVFTTTLLADMHLAGELSLDDRVNRFLPSRARMGGRFGDEVTLRHLATHTSGLARLPVNLSWGKLLSDNPYADYDAEDLYAGLLHCRLKYRPGTRTCYSNWGSGLLGHVLSLVGGADHERLIIERVLKPLGMHDTVIRVSDEQRQRLAPGHSQGKPARNWEFQALAGAGAFCSSLKDMLRFVQANLEPVSTPLGQAIELTHEVQTRSTWKWYRDFGCVAPLTCIGLGGLLFWHSFALPGWMRIALPFAATSLLLGLWQSGVVGPLDDLALGWHVDRNDHDAASEERPVLWHNGGTGGYRSYLAFSRELGAGVVLLLNSDHIADAQGRALLCSASEWRAEN